MAELYTREGGSPMPPRSTRPRSGSIAATPRLRQARRHHAQLTRSDPMMVDKDKQYWTMALEADPSYLPAMQRLLEAYLEDSQLLPAPQDLRAHPRHLQPDPDSRSERCPRQGQPAHRLAAELDGRRGNNPAADRGEPARTGRVQQKDPSNFDVPFMLARAKIMRATT